MKRKKMFLIITGFFYLLFLTDLEGIIRDRSCASVLSGDVLKSENSGSRGYPVSFIRSCIKLPEKVGTGFFY